MLVDFHLDNYTNKEDAMKIPSVEDAEMLLEEAAVLNPGPWVNHNRTAGFCTRAIAEKCDDMNPDAAYVMGLLHDVGRREGIMKLKQYFDKKTGMDIYVLLNV